MRAAYFSIIVALVAFVHLLPAVAATAKGTEDANAAISNNGNYLGMEAGSFGYVESEGVFRASGGVSISFKNYTIETESLTLDNEAGIVEIEDPFVMYAGDVTFSGETFSYNYSKDYGTLNTVRATMKEANFLAEQVDLYPGGGIIMKNVIATTCCLENKEYHIEAKRIELTPDGRAKFKKLSVYLKGHRLFKWPSYTMKRDRVPGADPLPSSQTRTWSYSPPTLGFSDPGGAEIKTDVFRKLSGNGNVGLFLNYYANDGLFTEAHLEAHKKDYNYSLRLGKQYKQNTGYFRYFGPVIVWNQPTLKVSFPSRNFRNTRLIIGSNLELGRMKEKHLRRPLERAYFDTYVKYPLNRYDKIRFSLLGDGRFAFYSKYKKYRVWGSGLEIAAGNPENHFLRLQYMNFRNEGATPFYSDLVDTNEKLFANTVMNVSKRNLIMIDAQYDLDNSDFDEIVYGFIRRHECLEFSLSWRAELRRIGVSMRILNPGEKSN